MNILKYDRFVKKIHYFYLGLEKTNIYILPIRRRDIGGGGGEDDEDEDSAADQQSAHHGNGQREPAHLVQGSAHHRTHYLTLENTVFILIIYFNILKYMHILQIHVNRRNA